ncbi:glycosyltransferase family 4 protein [Halobaculum sp. CBA1158]|uniref:glycosyltransferase family 4 protein n=1 Tax=Halobaculum sp. CBA1158 TaxID=2904243 RepID=UPI001F42B894|nr:glycosyltransferase family 4 protein [Halobaculum sp. CBA1158]UIO99142.1 glycosyltransferase family 4 protein [Halobaculum sp. CBA1158]
MRVLDYLELSSRLDRAGIGTAHDQQVAALERAREAGADVRVVTSPWSGGDPVAGVESGLRGRGFLVDADVIHLNLIGPASVALARHARRTDTPLVLHCHVTSEDFRESFRGSNAVAPALRRYLRWFYSRADLVLTPSEYTKRRLLEYPVDAPIRAISNGIDRDSVADHEAYREAYRERFDLDGVVMFAVGSVFERKGLTDFCEVARRTDHDFAWFGTVDSGPQASPTVTRWTSDPPENVTFTGWVDDKPGAFGAGDVFFFPSKEENQGIVVLEAMACGKPCVLRDIPVFREYFEHGHDCLLCDSREEFVGALNRLADDPDLRERLGENARETAAEHSLDRVGEELVAIYDDLLA